jgi:hypothetical protein
MCPGGLALICSIMPDDKTRLSAGSGLMLEKLLLGTQRWPAFDAFVVVSFPVGKIRSDAKKRLNIEPEIGSIFEKNPDGAIVVHGRDFDSFNDLATDNSERVWFASLAGTCRLTLSQLRLLEWCERLGLRWCSSTNAVRSFCFLHHRTRAISAQRQTHSISAKFAALSRVLSGV